MKPQHTFLSDAEFAQRVASFLADESKAGDGLFKALTQHATITAREFLGHDGPEIEDIVQNTVLAVLEWLRRRQGIEGSLVSFTITATRNRCRNYLVWRRREWSRQDPMPVLADYLASPELGPLDTMVDEERYNLLQDALDSIDVQCRNLLHAIYKENTPVEDLRRRMGLASVQTLYARRNQCLKKVKIFFKTRLLCCSSPEAKKASTDKRHQVEKNDD